MLFTLEPDLENNVELLLFRDVKNAKNVRAKLLRGEISAAFLEASLIVDVFQVLVAVSTALDKKKQNCMSTRNVFTEIVYNLSASRNISKALNRFGISENTADLIVAIPNATAPELADIRSTIEGTEQTSVVEGLKEVSDVAEIRKVYEVTEEEERCGSLSDSVVTRMACRDVG